MPGQCYQLDDNTSSFKDFHGSRNNRFTSPEQAAKNRIQHPSNVLHFFNAQPDISVEIFNQVKKVTRVRFVKPSFFYKSPPQIFTKTGLSLQVCDELGIKSPASVKLFTGKSELQLGQSYKLVSLKCALQKKSINKSRLFQVFFAN